MPYAKETDVSAKKTVQFFPQKSQWPQKFTWMSSFPDTLTDQLTRTRLMYLFRTILVGIFLSIVACTTFTSSSSTTEVKSLRFIGDVNISSDTAFQGTLLGGLSGVSYDHARQRLIAISDDRGEFGEPRFFEFSMRLSDRSMELIPIRLQTLKDHQGKKFKTGTIDFEGITLLENGNILLASEGDERPKNRIMPGLHQYDLKGNWSKNWQVPPKFYFEDKGKISKGVRFNKGFESLTSALDHSAVFTANENTLLQDGEIANERNQGLVRIVRYHQDGSVKEFAYALETIPNPENLANLDGDTGLVDMVAFDQHTLITMERSWVGNNKKNTIRLFSVSLKDAEDVSTISSLKEAAVKQVHKTPLLDLDDILDKLDEKWQKLDNLEGITFGPTLPNGHKTLILVSDNNFSRHQRTLFIAFEIIPN